MPWQFKLPNGEVASYATQEEDRQNGMSFDEARARARRQINPDLVNTVELPHGPMPGPMAAAQSALQGLGQYAEDVGTSFTAGVPQLGTMLGQALNLIDPTTDASRTAGRRTIGDMLAQSSNSASNDILGHLSPEAQRDLHSGSILPSVPQAGILGAQSLPTLLPTIGAAIASDGSTIIPSAIEGLMGAGSVSQQIDEGVRDIASSDPQTFMNSPVGRQALLEAHGNYSRAVELAANRAKGFAPVIAGSLDTLLGQFGEHWDTLLKADPTRARSLLVRMALSGGREAGEEFMQSGQEQIASNVGLANVNPHQDLLEGVAQQAVQGGITALPMGAGFGALRHRAEMNAPPPPPPGPTNAGLGSTPPPAGGAPPPAAPAQAPAAVANPFLSFLPAPAAEASSAPQAQPQVVAPPALPGPGEAAAPHEHGDIETARRIYDAFSPHTVDSIEDRAPPPVPAGAKRSLKPVPLYPWMQGIVQNNPDFQRMIAPTMQGIVAAGEDPAQSETFQTVENLSNRLYVRRFRDQAPAGYGVRIVDTLPDGTKQDHGTFHVPGAETPQQARELAQAAPTININDVDTNETVKPAGEVEQRGVFKAQPTGKPNTKGLVDREGGVRTPSIIRVQPGGNDQAAFETMVQKAQQAHVESGAKQPSLSLTKRVLGVGDVVAKQVNQRLDLSINSMSDASLETPKEGTPAVSQTAPEVNQAPAEEPVLNAPQLEAPVPPRPRGNKNTVRTAPKINLPTDTQTAVEGWAAKALAAHQAAGTDQASISLTAREVGITKDNAKAANQLLIDRGQLKPRTKGAKVAPVEKPAAPVQQAEAIQEPPKKRSVMGETDAFAARRPSRAAAEDEFVRSMPVPEPAKRAQQASEQAETKAQPKPKKPKREPKSPDQVREEVRKLDMLDDETGYLEALADSDLTKEEIKAFKERHPDVARAYSQVLSDLTHGKEKSRKLAEDSRATEQAQAAKLREKIETVARRAAKNQPSAGAASRAIGDYLQREGITFAGQKVKLNEAQIGMAKQLAMRAWLEANPQAPSAAPTPRAALAPIYKGEPVTSADIFGRKTIAAVIDEEHKLGDKVRLTGTPDHIQAIKDLVGRWSAKIIKMHPESVEDARMFARILADHWRDKHDFNLTPAEEQRLVRATVTAWYAKNPALMPPPALTNSFLDSLQEHFNAFLEKSGLDAGLIIQRAPITIGGQNAFASYGEDGMRLIKMSVDSINPEMNLKQILRTMQPWLSEEMMHAARQVGAVSDVQWNALKDFVAKSSYTEEDAKLLGDTDTDTGIPYLDAFAPNYQAYYKMAARRMFEARFEGRNFDSEEQLDQFYADWLKAMPARDRQMLQSQTDELLYEEAIGKALQVATARIMDRAKENETLSNISLANMPSVVGVVLKRLARMLKTFALAFTQRGPIREQFHKAAEQFTRDMYAGKMATPEEDRLTGGEADENPTMRRPGGVVSLTNNDGGATSPEAFARSLKAEFKKRPFPLANFIGNNKFSALTESELDRFNRAAKLKAEGKDNLSIWQRTNVAYDPHTGKPSIRLDNRDMQIKPDAMRWLLSGENKQRKFYLNELVDAPNLFKKVPHTTDLNVIIKRKGGGSTGSFYLRETSATGVMPTVELNVDPKEPLSDIELRRTIAHELDHYLSFLFHFTQGTSPETTKGIVYEANRLMRDEAKAIKWIESNTGGVDEAFREMGRDWLRRAMIDRTSKRPVKFPEAIAYGQALYYATKGEVAAFEASDALHFSDEAMKAPPRFLTKKTVQFNHDDEWAAALDKVPLAVYAGAMQKAQSFGEWSPLKVANIIANSIREPGQVTPKMLANLDNLVEQKLSDVNEWGAFNPVERAWNQIKSQPGFPKSATLTEWMNRLKTANVETRPTNELLSNTLLSDKAGGQLHNARVADGFKHALDKLDLIDGYKYSANTIEAIIRGNALRLDRSAQSVPVSTDPYYDRYKASLKTIAKRERLAGDDAVIAAYQYANPVDYIRNAENNFDLPDHGNNVYRNPMRKPGRPPGDVMFGHRLTNAIGNMAHEETFRFPSGDATKFSGGHTHQQGGYLNVLSDSVEARVEGDDTPLMTRLATQIQSDMVQSGFAKTYGMEGVPLQTTEQFTRLGLHSVLYQAAINGDDAIAIPTAEMVNMIQGWEGEPDTVPGWEHMKKGDSHANVRNYYETTVKNVLEKLGKKYGFTVERGSVTHYGEGNDTFVLTQRQAAIVRDFLKKYRDAVPGLAGDITAVGLQRTPAGVLTGISRILEDVEPYELMVKPYEAEKLPADAKQALAEIAYKKGIWNEFVKDSKAFKDFIQAGLQKEFERANDNPQQAPAYIAKITPEARTKIATQGFPLAALKPKRKSGKAYNPKGRHFGAAINSPSPANNFQAGAYKSIPNAPGYIEDVRDINQQLANVPTYAPFGKRVRDKRLKRLQASTLPIFGGKLDELDKMGEAHLQAMWHSIGSSIGKIFPLGQQIVQSYFPFGGIPEQAELLAFRSLAQGRIGEAQDIAGFVAGAVAKSMKLTFKDAMRALKGDYSGQNHVADKMENARVVLTARTKSELNAAANAINDPELSGALLEARQVILDVGRALTEHGVIHKRQFLSKAGADPTNPDAIWGGYLRRAYAEHFEDMRPSAGIRASGAHYRKMREDIPEGERLKKGEITDLPTQIFMSVEQPMRDLAIYNYFNSIMHHSAQTKNNWFLPDTVVMFGGKVRTLWYIAQHKEQNDKSLEAKRNELRNLYDVNKAAATGTTGIGATAPAVGKAVQRLVLEIAILEQQSQDMEAILKTNPQYATMLHEKKLPKGYKQIPDNPSQFGDAAGGIVMKQIYDDIMGGSTSINLDSSSPAATMKRYYTGLNRMVKYLYTVANIPTHARNMMSNTLMLTRSGTSIGRLAPAMADIVRYATTSYKSASVETAIKYGAMKQSFTEAEVRDMNTFMERVKRQHERASRDENWWAKMGPIGKVFHLADEGLTFVGALTGKLGKGLSTAYLWEDVLFKVAKIHDELERGTPPVLAAAEARENFFDYSAVNPWIRTLRTYAIAPFISYVYFAIPKFLEQTFTAPWRVAPSYLMYAGLMMLAASMFGFGPGDNDAEKDTLNQALAKRFGLGLLPFRDEHGRLQHPDFGYIAPEGALMQSLASLSQGDGINAMSSIGFNGGPVQSWITGLSTGIDPFRQQPIWDENDDGGTKFLRGTAFVGRSLLPPSINYYTPSLMGEPEGPGYSALFGAGVDYYGQPTQTPGQLASRWLGVNIYPNDVNYGMVRRINNYTRQIRDIRSQINMQYRNRANYAANGELSPAGQQRVDHWNQRLQAVEADYAAYVAETAHVADLEASHSQYMGGPEE